MFSGGVGEYVYGREERDFGDMGRRLGQAIRRRARRRRAALAAAAGRRVHPRHRARRVRIQRAALAATPATSRIRASCCRAAICRCCSRPTCAGRRSSRTSSRTAIRAHFTAFDLIEGEAEVALALRWLGAPSYERIAAFAEGIAPRPRHHHRSARSRSIIMLDGDIAQTLGRDPARGTAGRERDPGHRRRGAAGFRLHRSRPHPHAVLHRAGDDQVAACSAKTRAAAARTSASTIMSTGMTMLTIMAITTITTMITGIIIRHG